MIFKGTKEQCEELVLWLNNIMPGVIKFKWNFSTTSIEFLDLRIMIENGKLVTDLYVKPSNLQLYLDYNSNHPQHCKDGIVYSQALRVKERCSTTDLAVPHMGKLRDKFLERGYPPQLVETQFRKAEIKDRKELVFQKRKSKESSDKKIRLIFTHNEGNPPLHQWVREAKRNLITPKARQMADKFQVVFRQPRNMQQHVAGSKKKSGRVANPDAGCFKCNHCRVSCPILKETKQFSSTNTKRKYWIKERMDCDSPFVIYLATCNRCHGQYVGKSVTPFKKRHSNHKQEVKKKTGGLGQHYGGNRACSYGDISIVLIEQTEIGDREVLADREQYWQHQLRAFVENGGNAQCIRKEKISK
jgi:hypothetical protein